MRAERLRAHIGEAGFFHRNMATRATVHDVQAGQPDLLDPSLEVSLQRDRIAAVADHFLIAMLIMTPLAEVVFRGGDR